MARKKKKLGNCFSVHCAFILNDVSESWRLCHGTVWHRKVGWHEHCWLEFDAFGLVWCRDIANGNDMTIPQAMYYRVGKCKDVSRYNRSEVSVLIDKYGTPGPWPGEKHE